MKKTRNLCKRGCRYRNSVLKFVSVMVLLFAMSGLRAEAGETKSVVWPSGRVETDAVDTEVRRQVAGVDKRLKSVESVLDVIEARLGRAVHPPTLTRNVERRLQDAEKRLDVIERELKKVDALERTVKQLETRVRRVENKR